MGPRPEGYEVNHIDANKWNPRLDNLEYCTPRENMAHASRMGRLKKGIDNPGGKLSDEQVRRAVEQVISGRSRASVAREVGLSFQHMSDICLGTKRREATAGFVFPLKTAKPVNPLIGKPKTPEHRRKLALAHIGLRPSLETRLKMSNSQKGRKMSPEAIAKTAASHRGRKRSEATRQKLREAWTKRKATAVGMLT